MDVPTDGACAVCGRILNWVTELDGSKGHWDHGEQDKPGIDHEPIWTPEGSIRAIYRCDFCNQDTEPADLHQLPCREFQYVPGAISTDHWLCCPQCHSLIIENRWEHLLERAIHCSDSLRLAIMLGDISEERMRRELGAMYLLLRANITGPPIPFRIPPA